MRKITAVIVERTANRIFVTVVRGKITELRMPTGSSLNRLCRVISDMINNHMRPDEQPHLTLTPSGFKAEW